LFGFLGGAFCRENMRDAEPRDHPEEQEQAVIIPHVVRKALDKESDDSAEYAETYGFVGFGNGIFAEAEEALCESKNEDKKSDKGEKSDLNRDLQI
jgi:hypothetical protein